MLPAPHRLRASADLRATVRAPAGSRRSGRLVVVHVNRTDRGAQAPVRVGFVVSKAVGAAVVRNRTKRRLRALMASRLGELPGGTDVVVRANPAAAEATSTQLGAELSRLMCQAAAGVRR